MATVFRANKKPLAVKNLGWLLRNWQGVEWLGFNYVGQVKGCPLRDDGELVAKMRDGSTYITSYASIEVCWNFVNRPVFKGLKFNVVLMAKNGENRQHIIGSDEFNRVNKMDYGHMLPEILDYGHMLPEILPFEHFA